MLPDRTAPQRKEFIVNLVTDPEALAALFLLGLRLAILGAFLAFFFHLRRQARLHADRELDREWAELQRASRTAWRRVPQGRFVSDRVNLSNTGGI